MKYFARISYPSLRMSSSAEETLTNVKASSPLLTKSSAVIHPEDRQCNANGKMKHGSYAASPNILSSPPSVDC